MNTTRTANSYQRARPLLLKKEALDGAASEAEYEEDDNDYEDGDEEDDTSNDDED